MNEPTYFQNVDSVNARIAECPNADFSGGMNYSGSNAGGIGIATDVPDPKRQDWSILDQFGVGRLPQMSQYIGGNGLDDGVEDGSAPIQMFDNTVQAATGEANFTDTTVPQWESVVPIP